MVTVRGFAFGIAVLCVYSFALAQTGTRRLFTGSETVDGAEFAAAVNVPAQNVKAVGTVFIPSETRRVRTTLVLVEQGPRTPMAAQGRFGDTAWRELTRDCSCALLYFRVDTIRAIADDTPMTANAIRNAAAGGGEALLRVLTALDHEAGRTDIGVSPLLFWGWSSAASFGTTFAQQHPQRTVGFIRYHTQLRGVPAEMSVLRHIPALVIAGGKDQTAGTTDAEAFWKSARTVGAPWAFVIEPNASHADEEAYTATQDLVVPWVKAVVALRTNPPKTDLIGVTEGVGLLVNQATGDSAPLVSYTADRSGASWLPDTASVTGWQRVRQGRK